MSDTIDSIRSLTGEISRHLPSTGLAAVAGAVAAGLDEPLRLAVAGRVKAGKSTLLNAIVGEPLAPTDAGECTRVVTWYRHGLSRGAVIERHDGSRKATGVQRTPDALVVDLSGAGRDVARLEITWPATRLQSLTLIDTPGIGSIDPGAGARSARIARADDPSQAVDAVLYLTNQLHPADWRFLETFTDDAGADPDPSCAVAVLSRADEIAGGAADALDQAAAAAARVGADPAVRRSCQTVLALSALLAAGAGALTAEQHRLVGALAAQPQIDAALVTASRFAGVDALPLGDLSVGSRRQLLDQLGLYGVRAAVGILRENPATSSPDLVAALRSRSGLDDLLEVIDGQFLRRRDALRARASLRALWGAATRHGAGAEKVVARLERIESADHELAELQQLTDWRAGRLRLSDADGQDLQRWLDPGADDAPDREALLSGLDRWRGLAEHPFTAPAEAACALVVTRSIEARLAAAAR